MFRTMILSHLLAFVSLHESAADPAVGHNLPFGGSKNSGFATGASAGVWTNNNQLGLSGGNGAYLVQNAGISDWWGAKYFKLNLLGKEFSYTVDLSNMGCGCVACVYFVAMANPGPNTNYCDIQPGQAWAPCYELDIMEANSKAFHSSLHTHPGTAHDKSCNALGCSANIGRYPLTRSGLHTRDLYGPGASVIDTTHPFKVTARMDAQGHLETTLSQGDSILPLYNHSSAGNNFPQGWKPSWDIPASQYPAATGVPDYEVAKTVGAMQAGLVMAVTLWSGETHWLDQSACEGAPRCDMNTASFIVSDLQIRELSATTTTATTTATSTRTTTPATSSRSSTSSTTRAHPVITSRQAAEEDSKHTSTALDHTSMVVADKSSGTLPATALTHVAPFPPRLQGSSPLKTGGAAFNPYTRLQALPSAEEAKQVLRFPKAFESSTGREASAKVEAAAAATASISSTFSPNLVLVGLLASLPIIGCIIAAQLRSYLRSWSRVQRLDADKCLIGSE